MRALQPANASEETDMAQADEMGEGEGRDDGFIDGGGQEPFRRRSKKRAGESSSLSIYHDLIQIKGVGLVLLCTIIDYLSLTTSPGKFRI